MSDPNNSNAGNPQADAVAETQGYAPEPSDTTVTPQKTDAASKKLDSEVKRRNLLATFGSGPGKLALIFVVVVVVVFGVLAISGLRKPAQIVASDAQVDAPTTPPNRISTNTVTPEEAARRAEQSRQEAEAAQAKGGSYQPGFDYNIGESKKPGVGNQAKFSGFETAEESAVRHDAPGSARNLAGNTPSSAPIGTNQTTQQSAQAQQEQQRREQEQARAADKLAQEQKTAEGERDKYVEQITSEVVKQIGGMFNTEGNASLNNQGSFSQATYYNVASSKASGEATARALDAHRMATRKAIIKAGNTVYATLDSEANTDDGRTVLATVRSGPWKGAKLIGMIEQSYNNMSLKFQTMAPQDDRATMRINAVALREEDAKLGMAEKIDHHTFSRYTALAAAAFLQGAGRVYQQPIGTTVVTNGGIVTTTETPRDRQVIGSAVGEMGTAIGSEIRRRGFNQPSTYSTPAEKGFILYFLEDVQPTSDQQQQQTQQQNPQMPINPALPVAVQMPAQFPGQPGQGVGTPGFSPNPGPGYGATPYGYAPGGYGGAAYPGYAPGNDNRYRGPLNTNY